MRPVKSLLILLLLIIVSQGLAASPHALPTAPPLDHRDDQFLVKETIRRFVQAWNDDDAHELSRLFTPDGTLVSPTGSTATSRADIRELLVREHKDIFFGTGLSKTIQTITFSEPSMALVKGNYELSGVPVLLGVTTTIEGTFIFHLVKQEAGWFIEAAHITRQH